MSTQYKACRPIKNKFQNRSSGFTLIEILLVFVIIAILGTIAYPTYVEYVRQGNRTDGMGALVTAAQALERCSINNNSSYAGCERAAYDSPEGHYRITTATAATTFTVTATAQGPQAQDGVCTAFSLTNTGLQGATGSGSADECWNK